MNVGLITIIGTLGGITLGWGLTQFSNWYKERKDDNRVRKAVIFHLLEISYTLRKISKLSANLTRATIQQVEKLDTTLNINEQKIEKDLNDLQRTLAKEHIKDQIKLIGPDYENAISSLSPIEPIIAFILKGKSIVVEQVDLILEQYIKQISEKVNLTSEQEKQADNILKLFMEDTIYSETILSIESCAIEIAKQIGRKMKKKVEDTLKANAQIESLDEIRRLAEQFYSIARQNTINP